MGMSQKERIKAHLEIYGNITPLGALKEYGCFRLSAVIFDLRAEGMTIDTKMIKNQNGKHFAEYIHRKNPQRELDFS